MFILLVPALATIVLQPPPPTRSPPRLKKPTETKRNKRQEFLHINLSTTFRFQQGNSSLTDAHACSDSEWNTGKWMDLSQVIIKPTFRSKLQREFK